MSIVLAMEKELSTYVELETKELELARSDGVRIRCWLGRADTVQVGFGLLPDNVTLKKRLCQCVRLTWQRETDFTLQAVLPMKYFVN